MRVLELFAGTGSIGKVCKSKGYDVVSLDMILPANIKADIMKWDYKVYPPGHFDLITASPVCLWWSNLRKCWIGRKLKAHGNKIITQKILQDDINKYGKPMVDRVFEIIDYFKPKFWWIENPQTGKMKEYINKPYYDVDYCQYSDWGYKKRTRFWTNITHFNAKTCDIKTCVNVEKGIHKKNLATTRILDKNGNKILVNTKALRLKHKKILSECKKGDNKIKGTSKHDRYRIPPKLIEELLKCSLSRLELLNSILKK